MGTDSFVVRFSHWCDFSASFLASDRIPLNVLPRRRSVTVFISFVAVAEEAIRFQTQDSACRGSFRHRVGSELPLKPLARGRRRRSSEENRQSYLYEDDLSRGT